MYYEVLGCTTRYYEVRGGTTRYEEVLRCTTRYYEVLRATRRYYDVPRGCARSNREVMFRMTGPAVVQFVDHILSFRDSAEQMV